MNKMNLTKSLAFWAKAALSRPRDCWVYPSMLSREKRSVKDCHRVNWEKRQKLIRHAQSTVPYYRELFSKIGLEASVLSEDKFQQIPLLSKEIIRSNQKRLVSERANSRRLRECTTGGSTGVPLKLYHDAQAPTYALQWRTMNFWGVKPWMDTARIWRIPELIRKHPGLYKLKRWPSRVLTLDAANLGEQEINEFLQQWQKIRPEVLCGYVGGVDYVANFVLDKGCDLPPPRIVWLTAAPVTNVQRTTIRKAFRAPVYDQYACSEILYIAAECEYQNGLHVSSDYRHVEILNDNGEPCDVGEEGNVVVTDLENYVFPLIRYVTGDRASWMKETCECGRSLPLMSPVKGRVSEIIRLPSGKAISGEYLTTIFDDYPSAVRTFRVVQNRDHSLHVEYVPRNSEAIKAVQKVRHALEEIIQGEVRVSFICKEEIDNDRGKIRYITSELDTKNPGMPQA